VKQVKSSRLGHGTNRCTFRAKVTSATTLKTSRMALVPPVLRIDRMYCMYTSVRSDFSSLSLKRLRRCSYTTCVCVCVCVCVYVCVCVCVCVCVYLCLRGLALRLEMIGVRKPEYCRRRKELARFTIPAEECVCMCVVCVRVCVCVWGGGGETQQKSSKAPNEPTHSEDRSGPSFQAVWTQWRTNASANAKKGMLESCHARYDVMRTKPRAKNNNNNTNNNKNKNNKNKITHVPTTSASSATTAFESPRCWASSAASERYDAASIQTRSW
jgi:hypothetical protein